MSDEKHIELYKKYRPNTWEGLVGQQKVAKSLQGAVLANKVPTAFLFSGTHGTGKTSAALILAKAINCLDPQKNGDPCNTCEVCESIDNGTQLGVTYFSAANKSSVDDVRELVISARLRQPVKRQVFIIDEVHNYRSGKGFEALLIPLEATDMPAVFILCTTEIEKVPQTILSRVQQRRFSPVDAETMADHVRKISELEGLDLPEEGVLDAVRKGRGSVRDTLTALEGIVSTGEYSTSLESNLLHAIASHDVSQVMKVMAMSDKEGLDARDLAEILFEMLRDILLEASGVPQELIGILPLEDTSSIKRGFVSKQGIIFAMEEVGQAITLIAAGGDARINLELALIKVVNHIRRLKKAVSARP